MGGKKKKASALAVHQKKAGKVSKANPFETRKARPKFKVMGRRVKGQELKQGESRSKGHQKRMSTLGLELKRRNKANLFVDKRFGEGDANMTEEEKMLLRFQAETQKRMSKGRAFNLEDGSSDEEGLTHLGQSLNLIDNRHNGSDDEEDDEGDMDADVVDALSFGGGLFDSAAPLGPDGKPRPKSKKEVMDEVIMKSKYFKQQRQAEKDNQLDMTEKLDEEFDVLSALLAEKKRPILTREEKRAEKKKAAAGEGDATYDRAVRELASDLKAHVTDRLKTDEEVALEEKERLERLERERIRRMAGEASDDLDEEVDPSASAIIKLGPFGGEDSEEEEETLLDVAEALEEGEGEEEGEGDDDESKVGGVRPGKRVRFDESADEPPRKKQKVTGGEDSSEVDSDEEDSGDGKKKNKWKEEKKRKREERRARTEKRRQAPRKLTDEEKSAIGLAAEQDIPFTFAMPSDPSSLSALLASYPTTAHGIVLERLRACYPLSLGGDHKAKLELLHSLLLDRYVTSCRAAQTLPQITPLVPHLFALSQEVIGHAARVGRDYTQSMRDDIAERIANRVIAYAWPSFSHLMLIQLFTKIFPVSDFRHSIMTPCQLLLGQCLVQCPVESVKECTAGLFACNLLFKFVLPSRRFTAEPLSFLASLLVALAPSTGPQKTKKKKKKSKKKKRTEEDDETECKAAPPPPVLKWTERAAALRLELSGEDKARAIAPLDFMHILLQKKKTEAEDDVPARWSVLSLASGLLRRFVALYSELQPFPEIFAWLPPFLSSLPLDDYPEKIADTLKHVRDETSARILQVERLRKPLTLHARRAVALQTFAPKFEENYSMTKDYDPDTARAEAKKIRKQIKHEEKGAARELRKDALFIERARMEEQRLDDEERAVAVKRAMSMLESEQADMNAQKLMKEGAARKKARGR